MKTFWKILGFTALTVIILVYLAFLFILPNKIDINSYKGDLQKLVLESSGMTLDFDDAKVITTPALEAGIKIKGLNVKLPDGSPLIETDGIKVKLSLPNLLLLTVRVSQVQIDKIRITADTTADASQYKFMNVIQDLVNASKEKNEEEPKESIININNIRIKIANIKVKDYIIAINDLKSKHSLSLRGDEIRAYYSHRKQLKVKTKAELLSDNDVRVTLDADIDSVMPKPRKLDKDDETNYRADIGFVNPVEIYRDYNITSDIFAKLKLRQKLNGDLTLRGLADIENLSMELSGYRIPESYIRAKFGGSYTKFDTNLYAAPNQNLAIDGYYNFGRRPKLAINTHLQKMYFKNLVALTKAFMDTLNIKNDLVLMKTSGYITANTSIKTNFKKLRANGGIIVRDGVFINNGAGIKDVYANIVFDKNGMEIISSHLMVKNSRLNMSGKVKDTGDLDIDIKSDELPLEVLFKAFAPPALKKSYNIASGGIIIDAKISGTIKQAISDINLALSNLNMSTKDRSLVIFDKLSKITFKNDKKTAVGRIYNEDLAVTLSSSKSTISNPKLEIVIDPKNITINPMALIVNKNSKISAQGLIANYPTKKMLVDIKADGSLNSADFKQLMGSAAAPFVDAKGSIPLKLSVNGDNKRDDIILQLYADNNNYMTPVNINGVVGHPTIYQVLINYKMNRMSIKDTGMYLANAPFTDDLAANMVGAVPVIHTHGTIVKLDRPKPVINQFHVKIPKDLDMELCAFRNSHLNLGGNLLIFGQLVAPKINGSIELKNLSIPTLFTTMENLHLGFLGDLLRIDLTNLVLNGSDIQLDGVASTAPSSVFHIDRLNVSSNNIDVPKMMRSVDAMMKLMPPADNKNAQPSELPVEIITGSINMRNIVSPPLTLSNTTGRFNLRHSILRLFNLNTSTLGGRVEGRVGVNLLNTMISAKLKGEHFDVEKALLEVLSMKDAISGMASFETDLEINGAAKNQEEQMKGINGTIDFEILDGQLGPFGKLENLILAENIRESQFFQTALGGVINNLTQIQTSRFDRLTGHVVMDKGVAKLAPLTSKGPVMCMHIFGDINVITNEADMKLRAKLGSQIANMLGPLAAINPINLVKATPGLNVGAAKMFAIFCEVLTPKEMAEIPEFDEKFGAMSTTNFQIVLRGSTLKPLSMIKSFKWLATAGEMEAAKEFVATLPEADPENPNASLEEILAKQAEEERLANQNFVQKGARKFKEFFVKDKK